MSSEHKKSVLNSNKLSLILSCISILLSIIIGIFTYGVYKSHSASLQNASDNSAQTTLELTKLKLELQENGIIDNPHN